MANAVSVHDKCSGRTVYKLSVEGKQNTSITTTKALRRVEVLQHPYTFRIREKERIMPQHYILLLLWWRGPLLTSEVLAYLQQAGYPYTHSRQIAHKLARLRQNKLVEKNDDGTWRLTEKGERIAIRLLHNYEIIATNNEKIKPFLETLIISKTDSVSIARVERKYSVKILSKILEEIKRIHSLSEDESVIIELLVKNYAMNKVSYLYVHQVLKELNMDKNYFISIMTSLISKGLIYKYRDKDTGLLKIGLRSLKSTTRLVC